MFNNPSPGPGSVGEYQVSGVPFLSSSAIAGAAVHNFEFPYVTRDITVKNLVASSGSSELRVGVTSLGVQGRNYYAVQQGSELHLDIRTTNLFIYNPGTAGSYSLCAGLTCIKRQDFPALTGALSQSGVG